MGDYEYLYNQDFLVELDQQQNHTQYIKLTVLTMQNTPIGTIEGKATGGSISVNGSSAIRRTGSLSMIADESNYRITELSNIIYMNKKVSVEVGFKNNLNQYTEYDIIWLPLGIFVMSGANIQKNNSGINISLTLKDQMSLLNGENGGTFETTVIHSPIAIEKIDEVTREIKEEAILYYKLIYELVTKWGHIPPELIIIEDVPLTINNIVRWNNSQNVNITSTDGNTIHLELNKDGEYKKGQSVGFLETDFVYSQDTDLVSNAGESVASTLDKIKMALGNYEYFFDEKGFFHFQKIKDYLTKGQGLQYLSDAFELKYATAQQNSVYDFSKSNLITSYSNAPQWENIKNDFVVQGKNSDIIPIIYHLIIDNIPQKVSGNKYYQRYNDAFGVTRWVYGQDINNPILLEKKQYAQLVCEKNKWEYTDVSVFNDSLNLDWADWRIMAYFYSIENPSLYFYSQELIEEIPNIYDFSQNPIQDENTLKYSFPYREGVTPNTVKYWIDIINNDSLNKFKVVNIGKRTKVITDDKINCMFEPFFPNVCFIEASMPNTSDLRKKYKALGQAFYQLPSSEFGNIAIDSTSTSAYDCLRAQLHTILSFNESVSIGIVPIYHLEPNTRITIEDKDTNIYGDYIIKSFTLPLAANGQMTIQCTKAIEMI